MPRLREVEVWPSGAWPEQAWSFGPDLEVFARTTRGLCEAYSQALPGLELVTKSSTLMLNIENWSPRPQPNVTAPPADMVEIDPRGIGSREYGWIGVPVGFAELSGDEQRRLGLRIVHEGVLKLGRARGWDPVVLARPMEHVEAQGWRYQWAGPWKSAPDRRHQARAVAGIADDGMGRVHLEVATRAGELIARGDDVVASYDGEDLVWTCKTVRWDGSALVTMTAIVDPFGIRQCQPEIDLNGATPVSRIARPIRHTARFPPP